MVDWLGKANTLPLRSSFIYIFASHWRSSFTQLRTYLIKIATFKGGHLMWQTWFPCHKELLLKERIRFLWEQILSFKRSSHYEKGLTWRESLLDPVVSFGVRNFFNVLATPFQANNAKTTSFLAHMRMEWSGLSTFGLQRCLSCIFCLNNLGLTL